MTPTLTQKQLIYHKIYSQLEKIDRLRMLDTMMRWISVRDTVNRLFVSVAKCKQSDFLNIFFYTLLTCLAVKIKIISTFVTYMIKNHSAR